jgi:histone-lysine N-methyltransferase SETMAR
MKRKQCYEFFKPFKVGRMSVREYPSPGRNPTSTNDDIVDRVRRVIRGNLRLTVREVADEVGISRGASHQNFLEYLVMRRVSAKFVPGLSTDDKKENCNEISHDLLSNANGNENFLKNIIKGYEA